MVKWIAGIIIALLLIDHFWVHVGGPTIDRLRGEYKEISKSDIQKEEIPLRQSYRKSILDEIWEKLKEMVKREEGDK